MDASFVDYSSFYGRFFNFSLKNYIVNFQKGYVTFIYAYFQQKLLLKYEI